MLIALLTSISHYRFLEFSSHDPYGPMVCEKWESIVHERQLKNETNLQPATAMKGPAFLLTLGVCYERGCLFF